MKYILMLMLIVGVGTVDSMMNKVDAATQTFEGYFPSPGGSHQFLTVADTVTVGKIHFNPPSSPLTEPCQPGDFTLDENGMLKLCKDDGLLGDGVWASTESIWTKDEFGNVVLSSDYAGLSLNIDFTGANSSFGITGALNGMYVTGTYGSGAAPLLIGAGTRFMFLPHKASIRGGRVDGTQWNDGNVGSDSVALGQNNTASGANSVALGGTNTASGSDSIVIGKNIANSGNNTVVIGSLAAPSTILTNGINILKSDKYSVVSSTDSDNTGIGLFVQGGEILVDDNSDGLNYGYPPLAQNYTRIAYGAVSSLGALLPGQSSGFTNSVKTAIGIYNVSWNASFFPRFPVIAALPACPPAILCTIFARAFDADTIAIHIINLATLTHVDAPFAIQAIGLVPFPGGGGGGGHPAQAEF